MANTAINPGVGSITLSGKVPVLARQTNTNIYPDVGQLIIKNGPFQTGYGNPTYGDPTYENSDFSGLTLPTVVQTTNTYVGPLSGVIGLAGYAPGISQTNDVGSIGLGVLTITGFAPTVQQVASVAIVPGVRNMLLQGFAPTIQQPRDIVSDVGSLTLTGFAPSYVHGLNGNVGVLSISSAAPSIAQPIAELPAQGAVGIQGFAPTVSQTRSVSPSTYAMSITGYAPVIKQPHDVHLAFSAISINGFPPIVSVQSQGISPPPKTLTITGYAPSIYQFPSHIHRHVGHHTHRRPRGRVIVAND